MSAGVAERLLREAGIREPRVEWRNFDGGKAVFVDGRLVASYERAYGKRIPIRDGDHYTVNHWCRDYYYIYTQRIVSNSKTAHAICKELAAVGPVVTARDPRPRVRW